MIQEAHSYHPYPPRDGSYSNTPPAYCILPLPLVLQCNSIALYILYMPRLFSIHVMYCIQCLVKNHLFWSQSALAPQQPYQKSPTLPVCQQKSINLHINIQVFFNGGFHVKCTQPNCVIQYSHLGICCKINYLLAVFQTLENHTKAKGFQGICSRLKKAKFKPAKAAFTAAWN